MRCGNCGTPIRYEAHNQVWAHSEDGRYFCWDTDDYTDADCAEPQRVVLDM